MAENREEKKTYVKPVVRQIKLSLAELTLGSNCFGPNPDNQNASCPPAAALCNQ